MKQNTLSKALHLIFIFVKFFFNFKFFLFSKRYQLRGSINSSFVLLYEGLEDHFFLENAIPHASYEFEIFAFTYEENTFLAKSKAISLLTPSESRRKLYYFV